MRTTALAPAGIGLMGHVIADYPSPQAARDMIGALVEVGGAKVIEIQIPFSEPMADGPVFMAANHAAVDQGVDYDASCKLMAEMTKAYPEVDFVFMSYLNVIFQRGYEGFVQEAQAVGARGVIIPDLPLEEAATFDQVAGSKGFDRIVVIPPNCPDERLEQICKQARGLIYAVARAGVTGSDTDFSATVPPFLAKIRAHSAVPIAVGFGVKAKEHVQALKGLADLAVVGTQSLRVWQNDGAPGFGKLWQELAAGCR